MVRSSDAAVTAPRCVKARAAAASRKGTYLGGATARGGGLLLRAPPAGKVRRRRLLHGAAARRAPPRPAVYFSTAATVRRAARRVARAAGDGAGVEFFAIDGAGRILSDGRLPGGPLRRKCGKILPRTRRRGRGRPRRARGGNAIATTVRDAPATVGSPTRAADAGPSGDGRRPDAHLATVLGATFKSRGRGRDARRVPCGVWRGRPATARTCQFGHQTRTCALAAADS